MSDGLWGVLLGSSITFISTLTITVISLWNARHIAERQMVNQRVSAREEALRRWRIERALPTLDIAATRSRFYDEFARSFDDDDPATFSERLTREQPLTALHLFGIADEPMQAAIIAFMRADAAYIKALTDKVAGPSAATEQRGVAAYGDYVMAVAALNRAFEDYAFRAP